MPTPLQHITGLPTAEQFNRLVDFVNSLLIAPAAPVQVQQTPAGQVLSLARELPSWGDPNCPRKVLAAVMGTQDTDTWAVEDDGRVDGNGYEVQVMTDPKFDTTTHLFTARMRTLKADKYGRAIAVTGEGSPSIIFTTEAGCS